VTQFVASYRLDQLMGVSAAAHPDRPAARDETSELSYRELDETANRIASTLRESGVRIGDRVGVHLEKSVRTVASIYGVMRAGAAYVPIDPAAPAARSALIAADCEIKAIISDPGRIQALREVDPSVVAGGICIGEDTPAGFIGWDEVQQRDAVFHELPTVDADLAYVLYTSGSTGMPKGVAISHRTSLTFIRWAYNTMGFTSEDVFSSHAPFHFDLSTLDLYGAAAAGAAVSIVPRSAALFPVKLAEWIRAREITVWYSVPSALTMLVRYGNLAEQPLDSVRLLLFAGEVFPIPFLRELMLQVPRARYFNLYGPTETNVCTYHEVTEPPGAEDPPVPIGRACENTRCDVVDATGSVTTAVGAEGELVVHGSTVANGYWGDAEKTARGFPKPGTYRTGDIVSIIREDPATYRFVGRNDHLIKSRGYRIELGEVEVALHRHPQVEECVVVAVPDELLGNRLAAFCIVRGEVPAEDLKRTCQEHLPAYMVPDTVWLVGALPRTANDKYDRAQLTSRAAELSAR
jgi:amino acid adenylation domain-containing protein